MTDFAALFAPHRTARRLPLPERYAAAVDWAETQIKAEMPTLEDVIDKLRKRQTLTDQETKVAISALTKKSRGRPSTEHGRNLWIRQLVRTVAREFGLSLTRGNIGNPRSAADAVADAMKRAGRAPGTFDRVRKLHARAAPEEAAFVRAYFRQKEAERHALEKAIEKERKRVDALLKPYGL